MHPAGPACSRFSGNAQGALREFNGHPDGPEEAAGPQRRASTDRSAAEWSESDRDVTQGVPTQVQARLRGTCFASEPNRPANSPLKPSRG